MFSFIDFTFTDAALEPTLAVLASPLPPRASGSSRLAAASQLAFMVLVLKQEDFILIYARRNVFEDAVSLIPVHSSLGGGCLVMGRCGFELIRTFSSPPPSAAHQGPLRSADQSTPILTD
eukprot:GHVU01184324.1.p2 GENE.GHVU01184324.1~~GHVU01184324.1.p2  ORF type:complete len:120 (-),score=26.92 GHVU01184324.1:79-438(-)